MLYLEPNLTLESVVVDPWTGDLNSLVAANNIGYQNPWWKDGTLDLTPVSEKKRVRLVHIPQMIKGSGALDAYFESINATHCTLYTLLNLFAQLGISLRNCRRGSQVCALGTRGWITARFSAGAIGKCGEQNRLTAVVLEKIWKPNLHCFLCEA